MTTSIAVAIVNYNTREHLRACLETVRLENPGEVVVVDNASPDNSAEMVQAEFPWVRLHANKTNPGFGAAANQAIANCTAKYVLLLNSDVLLQPGALEALSSYLDLHPRAAIVGPRLVGTDGTLQTSCYPFPTALNTLLLYANLAPLIRYFPVLRSLYLAASPHNHARAIPWVKGAALAIRREVFEALDGFDESFFMYSEEVDLCYRLGVAGWQVHFAPVTTVVHVGGASTMQHRTEMAVQLLTSNLRFCQRHYSGIGLSGVCRALKIVVLAKWILERARLRFTRDRCERARIRADLAVWHRALRRVWREGTADG